MIQKLWLVAAACVTTLTLGSCQKVDGPSDVPAFAAINGD